MKEYKRSYLQGYYHKCYLARQLYCPRDTDSKETGGAGSYKRN